jgi:hypothetical protein
MTCVSLGKVTDTAGAQTRLTTDTTIKACRILFRGCNANAGTLVSVGLTGFTPGGAGMIGEILKSSSYSDPIDLQAENNQLTVADYAVKPATNGDGVYVSYYQI